MPREGICITGYVCIYSLCVHMHMYALLLPSFHFPLFHDAMIVLVVRIRIMILRILRVMAMSVERTFIG